MNDDSGAQLCVIKFNTDWKFHRFLESSPYGLKIWALRRNRRKNAGLLNFPLGIMLQGARVLVHITPTTLINYVFMMNKTKIIFPLYTLFYEEDAGYDKEN